MTTRPSILLLFLAIPLVSTACPDDPPEPLTPAEVFATCDVETLCSGRLNQPQLDPAIAACVYEALRDRTPGQVGWEFVYTDVGVMGRFDLFIGADGRVLRWTHDGGIELVEDVELRTPEFFAGCLSGIDDAQPPDCPSGQWFEGEAITVEAACVTSPP